MTLVPRRDYRNVILFETSQDNLNDLILAEINLEGGLLTFQSAQRCDFTNANLRWTHWRQADLSGSTLNGADMTDSNLDFAKLRNIHAHNANLNLVIGVAADFSDSTITESQLNYSNLRGSIFTHCDLTKSEIMHANLQNAKFIQTCLRDVNFSYTWFDYQHYIDKSTKTVAELSHCDISNAIFYKSDIRGLDLTKSVYDNVNFEYALYDNTTKWPSNLNPIHKGAIFVGQGVDISNNNLSNLFLEGADLKNITGYNVNFQESKLPYTDFSNAYLIKSNFSYCILHNSTFANSNLRESSFLQAHLYRCNFENSDIRGADMRFDIDKFKRKLENNNTFTLKNAKYDKTTIWPDGFDPRGWDR